MGTRVYIGGLPYRVKERDIERFFRGYGKLREVLIKNGYGFVEFEDYRDADDAVYELNGKELCGERVSVEHARGSGRRGRDGRDDRGYDRDRGSRRGGGSWMDNAPPRYGPPTRTDYRLIVENLSSRVSWQTNWAFPPPNQEVMKQTCWYIMDRSPRSGVMNSCPLAYT